MRSYVVPTSLLFQTSCLKCVNKVRGEYAKQEVKQKCHNEMSNLTFRLRCETTQKVPVRNTQTKLMMEKQEVRQLRRRRAFLLWFCFVPVNEMQHKMFLVTSVAVKVVNLCSDVI